MDILLAWDTQVFLFINHLPHTPFLDTVAHFFSGVGTGGIIWIAAVLFLFFREEKRDHWFFFPSFLVGIGTIISEYLFKALVARPRPTPEMGALIIGQADNFSFPSSHATLAFAFATLLAAGEPKGRIWFYLLAAMIAFSRVYLGVHYPLDIVGGAFLGWLIGHGAHLAEEHLVRHKKNLQKRGGAMGFLFAFVIVAAGGWFFAGDRHTVSYPLNFQNEKQYVESLFAKKDPQRAFEKLLAVYETTEQSFVHDLAHVAGTALFRRFGKEGIRYCGDEFEWGCYHGFLSQAISSGIPPDVLCQRMVGVDLMNCSHGIGHGLLLVYTYSISGLERSLIACETLREQFSACAGGVFMEYNTGRTTQLMGDAREAVTRDAQKIFEPCESLSRKFQAECFLDQAPRWFIYITQEPNEIIALCARVRDSQNRVSCYRGIARITPTGKTKPDMLAEFCLPIRDPDGAAACRSELGI